MSAETALPTPPSDDTVARQRTIIDDIKRLSIGMINAHNTRDFDFTSAEARDVLDHTSPDFLAEMDGQPEHVTLAEQVAAWRRRVQQYPDFLFHVLTCDVELEEDKGEAVVWMEMEATGLGVELQAMNRLEWKREASDGRWMCYKAYGWRGSRANSGFG